MDLTDTLAATAGAQAVILVEGESDRAALETLAERRGRDLPDERVAIVPMGGAMSAASYVGAFHDRGTQLAGLYDVAEEPYVQRALERVGLGPDLDRAAMAALGFHACDADLEDELIRALGVEAVERVIEAEQELRSWHSLRQQPAQRDRPVEDVLRRFMSSRSGRKAHYARRLVQAVDLAQVPVPLDAVLLHVQRLRTPTRHDDPTA